MSEEQNKITGENIGESSEKAAAETPAETPKPVEAQPERREYRGAPAGGPGRFRKPDSKPYFKKDRFDNKSGGDDKRRGNKRFPRRKVCSFCLDKSNYLDYKDMKRLKKFVTERGKILPRRISGNCAFHQRKLTTAIKRARNAALLPFRSE